jgi:hypothetical protein
VESLVVVYRLYNIHYVVIHRYYFEEEQLTMIPMMTMASLMIFQTLMMAMVVCLTASMSPPTMTLVMGVQ